MIRGKESVYSIRFYPAKFISLKNLLLVAVSLVATASPVRAVDFENQILPILQEHCIDCHGPDAAESDLRLDSLLTALRGGDSGEAAIVPGDSKRSDLIHRLTSDDAAHQMPPDGDRLPPAQVELFKAWIDDAELWQPAKAELAKQTIDHWSFQPLQRPTVPNGSDSQAHAVDASLDAKLSAAGLSQSPTAPRRRLVRRAYQVLHGLPPTPQQVDAFVGDTRDNAWELLVEELLASPRYGEAMATQWLDLVRFGETHGFETNRERPNAWYYRDWVVDAFNADQPYDDFVRQQIAGDALGADVATGFLVGGPYDLVKGADPLLRLTQRQDELADIVNTTGTAFLGLSLGCARCHNHKFDPVSQTDYYAMQAVFSGVNHAERALPLRDDARKQLEEIDRQIADARQHLSPFVAKDVSRPAVDAKGNVEQLEPVDARFVRFTILATNQSQPCIDELEIFSGDQNVALASGGAIATSNGDFVHPLHKLEHINDGRFGNARSWIAAKASGGWVQIELPKTQSIDRIQWARDSEGRYRDRLATEYRIEISIDGDAWTEVANGADRLPHGDSSATPIRYDFAHATEAEAEMGRQQLQRLEELNSLRESLLKTPTVYAGTFSQPAPTHRLNRGEIGSPREQVAPAAIRSLTDLSLASDTPEQQRRVAIANWIASADNPLTARVFVNRIWQFHFGTGIVDTPSDFGGNGTPPTHPELLDWLAAELIDSGWSTKHIHRLILTSKAWQQDSLPRDQGLAVDASSRLLWRFPPRRLSAEAIRDSILSVTGKLDLKQGGPGFSAFEIEPENVRHYFPKKDFGPADWRRMVYMTRVRQERDAVFGVFDCPDFNQVVPQRNRSTTPLQALNLLNSRFVLQQADFLVQRLESEASDPAAKVALAYQLCFSRLPDAEESTAALAFVQQNDWQQFARAILNANEFVFVP
ncbi:Planctomycete cytochrome C [Rosistilla ulvae]|uniref:Planctomycete cytochrome C n=1 Tax=Rosistilla ulvae TaxID=1930277 RepID=A0A517LVW9_9BACT|nr:DUF1553 domain-containing protein [Rosistilla ulvae]QDS86774.1 Planctomycete cytochrome C [Rosistilla ulvae]